MRGLSRFIPLLPNKILKVKQNANCLKNFTRLLNQQQVTLPSRETLTGRMFLYLNIDEAQKPNPTLSSTELLDRIHENHKLLHKLEIKEISTFLISLKGQTMDPKERSLIFKRLEMECCLRLNKLSSAEILNLLNTFMNIIPNRITEFEFYKRSVKILSQSLHELDKKGLLQLIFFIGLQKKNLESQMMLRNCMAVINNDFINNLTSEELCIICSATFKTSTKIRNKYFLEKVREFINNNLAVLNDSALFVTLVKTLRHNRYQNDDLLNTITCTIFFNKTYISYSFTMICHIMALYADYFYYDENLFPFLTKQSLEQLSQNRFISKKFHPVEQFRGKDIKRFLWVMSMFSEMKLLTHSDIKSVIIPKIIECIEGKEFYNDLNSLFDITLYLWMLNYQPSELVPYVFNNKIDAYLKASDWINNLRLKILLYTIKLEKPDFLEQLSIDVSKLPISKYVTEFQLKKRPFLQRILNNLNFIKGKLNLDKFELSKAIPHLNIIGITGYKHNKDKVYIELLDDYTRLKNTEDDVAVGLMALKIRLLDRSEQGVLVVSQKEIEDMIDTDLSEFLLDELKLIC